MVSELAINGGPKVRIKPLPYRAHFGEAELEIVTHVFRDSWQGGADFGYQGRYEKLYTDQFCRFQGGGFADAVSSGTAAVYLALGALNIEPGSDVVVSPVTDPGGVSPVIIAGMNIVIADSERDSFNVGPAEFEKAITAKTRAAVLTHVGGLPIDIEPIIQMAKSRGIKIIEDCSQAHGAMYKGQRVGCFGDIAAFSTMFSKNHATGGCGGIVYTRDEDYYWLVRSLADRGKPFRDPDFDPKNPSEFLFPALNFNLDELSCAIGASTLSRLPDTIDKRYEIAGKIDTALEECLVVSGCRKPPNGKESLFFHTVEVDVDRLSVPKAEFAEAVAAEGIWINPHYKYVVSEWKWVRKYLSSEANTPNAVDFRDRTFNILFNEQFTDEDIRDVIASIRKVESVLAVK
jgi:dTDP-4-amino-4,6-dideoxygalactose transaminase